MFPKICARPEKMNKTSFQNITNYNNISLLNISNSTHNNNYFNSRFKNHHIWVFFFFIAIFFIPFLTPLICLTIELFNFMRPKDININIGISDSDSEEKLYFIDELNTQNTLEYIGTANFDLPKLSS